ncbi:MAG: tetratricopeptide repeat protein [Gammaproteobacteria bacterium]
MLFADALGRSRRSLWIAAALALLIGAVIAASLFWRPSTTLDRTVADRAPGTFLGSDACASCHADEHAAWSKSQHARAMQHATEATVLGDFKDSSFRYAGVTTRFFRRDGKFFVRTDGADGQLADHEIKYTFGVEPLQQYLIELPGGHWQALSISWDARPREQGGQRWFHLYPKERIDHRDELHWTQPAQNWNFMCADCHSTDIRRNYLAEKSTFDTRWADLAVGCEACHGPGSTHVAAPGKPYRVGMGGQVGAGQDIPATDLSAAEMESCAACHARRAQIDEGARAGDPLLDHYLPSTLDEGLYHADGQQLAEVFVWGSFLQSRKYAAGVTCGACHEPHTQKLRKPGNEVCTQCHVTERFDTSAHHHHQVGSAACVNCHMREATYMVVDRRRDHGFHVPRPDLTQRLGTPNACNDCHADRDARWADAAIVRWYGTERRATPHFGEALHAGRRGEAGAVAGLLALLKDQQQTAIVRATAIELLARYPGDVTATAIRGSLADADPLVRYHALLAQQGVPPDRLAALVAPMLEDRVRAVRHEAARQLTVTQAPLDAVARQRLTDVVADYERVLRLDLSRAEPWLNIANLKLSRGDMVGAESDLRQAIAVEPRFVPAWVNLADVLRAAGRDAEAETLLRDAMRRDALKRNATVPALREALGFVLVRQGRKAEAMREFEAAYRAAPETPRFRYVYALALHDAGQVKQSLGLLEEGLGRRYDRDSLLAVAAFARDAGDNSTAERALQRLRAVNPGDPALRVSQ